MSPLVLAVGSQLVSALAGFCAAIGAATAAPRAKPTTRVFTKAFIKDLPDLLKKGVEKVPVIYRPAFFVPPDRPIGLWMRAACFLHQLKGAPDVDFGGVDIPDGDPKGIPATDTRVREVNLARCVHPFQDSRVVLVEFFRRHAGRTVAEYHRRKLAVGQSFKLHVGIDPTGKPAGDHDVLLDDRSQALDSEMPDHEPKFERAKPAAEGNAVVHQIHDFLRATHEEKLRNMTESTLQQVGSPRVEHRAIHRGEQPLVRIHDQGIRPIATVEDVPHLRNNGRGSPVRSIDVKPHLLPRADVCNRGYRIDGRGRSRSYCCYDGKRDGSGAAVALNGFG